MVEQVDVSRAWLQEVHGALPVTVVERRLLARRHSFERILVLQSHIRLKVWQTFTSTHRLLLSIIPVSNIEFIVTSLWQHDPAIHFGFFNFKVNSVLQEFLVLLKYFQAKTIELNSLPQCLFDLSSGLLDVSVLRCYTGFNLLHFFLEQLDGIEFLIWSCSGNLLENL